MYYLPMNMNRDMIRANAEKLYDIDNIVHCNSTNLNKKEKITLEMTDSPLQAPTIAFKSTSHHVHDTDEETP